MNATCQRSLAALAFACASGCACASGAPRPPATASAAATIPSDLPRSSIAAVLAHRAELALDEAQVKQLEDLDREREKQDAEVRAQRGPSARADRARMEARSSRARRSGQPGDAAGGALRRLLDDDDTRAYLMAEQVLRPEQRERARDIAERYRESRSDERSP